MTVARICCSGGEARERRSTWEGGGCVCVCLRAGVLFSKREPTIEGVVGIKMSNFTIRLIAL